MKAYYKLVFENRTRIRLATCVVGDLRCRHVDVTFKKGRTREIFSGRLTSGERITEEFNRPHKIKQVTMTCWAVGRRISTLTVQSTAD